jgi:hypothetical protein
MADVLFGQLGSPGAPFGQFFFEAAPPGPATVDSFSIIGPDLWDTTDDDASVVLRFTGLKKTDGKRFLEEQIYQPLGLYSPILADGSIGLRRMNPILADAPYVVLLNEDSFVQVGALQHDYGSLINVISIDWNYDFLSDELTRRKIVIDQGSIDVHGEGEYKNLEWKGMHGSRHTDAAMQQRIDALRDRYAAPPLRLSGTLLHRYNTLEVGDVVRVQLAHVRDYTGAVGPIDRSFEVQRIAIDQVTGEVSVNLFGSSQRASVIPPAAGPALDDAWYTSQGTNLSTVCTIVGGVIQAGTYNLTGHAELNHANAIYYYNGDLELSSGATLTVNNNVQLRVRGFFTINGDIDGIGRGQAGGVEDGVLANQNVGLRGFVGSTRGWEGLQQYSAFSSTWFRRTIARTVTGLNSSFPYIELLATGGSLSGLPLDLRGTSGSRGGRITTLIGGEAILADAGDGGDSGAGLAIICRGAATGISGEIDLSGADSTLGDDELISGTTYNAGSGAPGGPGALFIVIDGSAPSLPDVDFIATYGSIPSAGNTPSGESSASVLWTAGTPRAGFNTSISGDISESAYRVQRIAGQADPEEDVLVPVPTDFAVQTNAAESAHVLTNTIPPANTVTEYFASATNDRGDSVNVGGSTSGYFVHIPDPDTVTYYWARNKNISTQRISGYTPDTVTTTVIGEALDAPGGGTDGLSIAELGVFRRSETQPATPTGGSYNFGTLTLTPPAGGWTSNVPTGNSPLWTSRTVAAVQGITGIDSALTWSTTVQVTQDGSAVDIIFKRSATQPTTPAASSGVPATWFSDVNSEPTNNNPMWSSVGTRANAGQNWTWETPLRVEGLDGITGLLTNESHVVSAASDGTGYSLTGSGGTFVVLDGTTDVTTSATFSVQGSATKNGLTMSINSGTGVYSLSGGSWTSSAENFTLRAVYAGVTIDKVYSIAKATQGTPATPPAEVSLFDLVGATSTNTVPTNSFCGVRLTSGGDWETTNANATSVNFSSPQFSGTWLISGSSSNVWVEAELMTGPTGGGTFASNSGFNTRLQLNSTRTWVVDSSAVGATVAVTFAVQFKFYSAATGGQLLEISPARGYTAIETP